MSSQSNIRNFCIIAHIDHGKSTLADRLLELTGTVEKRQMREQLLDRMDLEREKGITIKLQPVRMNYQKYELNLIDTPGHVDFSYEVSRSLEACEGALLVVDATQGIQAQTLANVYLAMAADLHIVPVLNKIDLPAADIGKVSKEIISLLGCKESDILQISAKTGEGVEKVLERIVLDIPEPKGDKQKPLRALVFDSMYDDYRGVILFVRVVDGSINKNQKIKLMAANSNGIALEIGALTPDMSERPLLDTGEIGYIVTNLKSVHEAKVGDTIASVDNLPNQALPGYKEVQPFVYAGIFPSSNEDYHELKDALEKLALNDCALVYEPENSQVLGFGFRIGFLGLLHMDIVKERLEREYNLELIITNPSTEYEIVLQNQSEITIKNAADLPDASKVLEIREPWIKGEIVSPKEYLGGVLQHIINSRGHQKHIDYVDNHLSLIEFEAPLANVLTDFYDQLKSITSGYGSFNYDLDDYRAGDLVRLDFLVAGERVDALSIITHRNQSMRMGRETVEKLREVIPKQLFQVSLQAAINGKIIARENIQALKKNVTGHLYGGDVSRKKKLWAKQKRGKARMKKFGKVEIPNEAFTVLLNRDK
ncbi:elongation factor 4 [Candidatus Saccharibacteria bacterium CPR2]|nr:elongation factor 4 [Candidatus Saccharibacteria bacterium CPR2]